MQIRLRIQHNYVRGSLGSFRASTYVDLYRKSAGCVKAFTVTFRFMPTDADRKLAARLLCVGFAGTVVDDSLREMLRAG